MTECFLWLLASLVRRLFAPVLFIVEGQVEIDDLLVMRPGSIVRVQYPDAVRALWGPVPLQAMTEDGELHEIGMIESLS